MSPGAGWWSGKIHTFGWFLMRPQFYGQAVRVLRYRILPHQGERTRAQATQWCRDRAISTREGLALVLGPGDWSPLSDAEGARYANALEVAQGVPVTMGGPGDLDLLYHLARQDRVTKVVETGVAFGWSSLAILLGLGSNGRLISTDMPYVQGGNESYVGCVVPQDLREGWTLTRLADRQALPRALKALGTIHLCHYDSDKSYVGRMWAYRLLWTALEPGGFFVSDDVGDNDAFRVVAESVGVRPTVIQPETDGDGERYVGVLVKPRLAAPEDSGERMT